MSVKEVASHEANVFLPGCLGPVRRDVVLLSDHEEFVAALLADLKIQVCKLGRLGAAFDPADTRYAYTYKDQPDNIAAMKLGRAAGHSAAKGHSDFIDRGLDLLMQLQAEGFGVFQIDEALSVKP